LLNQSISAYFCRNNEKGEAVSYNVEVKLTEDSSGSVLANWPLAASKAQPLVGTNVSLYL